MNSNYHTSTSPGKGPFTDWMLYLLAIILVTLMISIFSGCITREKCMQRFPPEITNKDSSHSETIISYRDTSIFYPADTSAWVKAIAECDSLGNVRLTNLQKEFGRRSEAMVSIKDNVLTAKCKIDSMSIYLKLKETYEKNNSVAITTIKVPYPVEKQLTWWEQFKVAYGGYALISWLILIVLIIIMIIAKIYLKVQIPFLK